MPTLEELFKSKKLDGGQTAQQKYDVRNSKDTPNNVANVFISNVAMPLQQIARRNISTKNKETFLEEETTGLRILRSTGLPFIYGTDIIRLTTGTTTVLDVMKKEANGSSEKGALTGLLSKAKDKATGLLSKMGISLPQDLIPTRIKANDDFSAAVTTEYPVLFAKIKKDGAGSLIGKFLAQNAQGTPNQIGGQIIGGATQMVKDQIKNGLFGSNNIGTATGGSTTGVKQGQSIVKYKDKYGNNTIHFGNGRGGSIRLFDFKHYAYNKYDNYSSFFFNGRNKDYLKRYLEDVSSIASENEFTPLNLPGKIHAKDLYGWNKEKNKLVRYGKINDVTNETANNPDINEYGTKIADYTLEKSKGFSYNNSDGSSFKNYGDFLNTKITHLESEEKNNKLPLSNPNEFLDDFDFIPLKFYSMNGKKSSVVQFRATISGLSETFRPSWESNKFVGNPFNYYTYTGIERSIAFKFKVFSLSAHEHINAWERLKFLASLVYPMDYEYSAGYVKPPFIKFTLGDLYTKKEGFIETLTYSIDDNSPWEIGLNSISGNGNALMPGKNIMKDYKLPILIDVDITIKFVENATTHTTSKPVEEGTSKSQTKTTVSEPKSLYASGKTDKTDRGVDNSGAAKLKEQPKDNTSSNNPNGSKQGNNSKETPKTEQAALTNAASTTKTVTYSGYYDPKNPDADPQAKAVHDKIQKALQKAGQTPTTFDTTVYKIPN
jgi:hypothetical protein